MGSTSPSPKPSSHPTHKYPPFPKGRKKPPPPPQFNFHDIVELKKDPHHQCPEWIGKVCRIVSVPLSHEEFVEVTSVIAGREASTHWRQAFMVKSSRVPPRPARANKKAQQAPAPAAGFKFKRAASTTFLNPPAATGFSFANPPAPPSGFTYNAPAPATAAAPTVFNQAPNAPAPAAHAASTAAAPTVFNQASNAPTQGFSNLAPAAHAAPTATAPTVFNQASNAPTQGFSNLAPAAHAAPTSFAFNQAPGFLNATTGFTNPAPVTNAPAQAPAPAPAPGFTATTGFTNPAPVTNAPAQAPAPPPPPPTVATVTTVTTVRETEKDDHFVDAIQSPQASPHPASKQSARSAPSGLVPYTPPRTKSKRKNDHDEGDETEGALVPYERGAALQKLIAKAIKAAGTRTKRTRRTMKDMITDVEASHLPWAQQSMEDFLSNLPQDGNWDAAFDQRIKAILKERKNVAQQEDTDFIVGQLLKLDKWVDDAIQNIPK